MQAWENLVKVGTIVQIDSEHRALARVKIADRITDFIPVLMFANSYKTHWTPLRVGEQVAVFSPFGNADSGFVVRGMYNKGCKESVLANDTTEVMEYEDGTVMMYDTTSSTLFINCTKDIKIINTNNYEEIVGKDKKLSANKIETNSATTSAHSAGDMYSVEAKNISIVATSGGSMSCGGGSITMVGDFTIQGNLTVTGSIFDSKGDLTNHAHPDASAR